MTWSDEYVDYPSAIRKKHLLNKHFGYDDKLHLMVRLQYGALRNVGYSFTAITPRSTLTWIGSTC